MDSSFNSSNAKLLSAEALANSLRASFGSTDRVLHSSPRRHPAPVAAGWMDSSLASLAYDPDHPPIQALSPFAWTEYVCLLRPRLNSGIRAMSKYLFIMA